LKFEARRGKITKYKLHNETWFGIRDSTSHVLVINLSIQFTVKEALKMIHAAVTWFNNLGLICYKIWGTNRDEKFAITFKDLLLYGHVFGGAMFELLCYWEFQCYKPAILGSVEECQIVNEIMNATGVSNGSELLDLLKKMADRLLDYRFWFNEIKAYRKLKRLLTPPKAIEFWDC
jgi:hypothetical protein